MSSQVLDLDPLRVDKLREFFEKEVSPKSETVTKAFRELIDQYGLGALKMVEDHSKKIWVDGIPPVTPEKFFSDPYFLGEWGKELWPVWKRDLCYIINNNIRQWILGGAQGTGKTTAALAAQLWCVYFVSRLKKPQVFFHLNPISKIYFGLFSLNKEKSRVVLHEEILAILNQCPYFRDRFETKKRRTVSNNSGLMAGDEMDPEVDSLELILPNGIRIVSGSLTSHVLSLNVISGVLDEMNWRRKKTVRPEEDPNSALSLYEQTRTRISGRFPYANFPFPFSILCVVSSKRATTDFMDVLSETAKRDPHSYVSDYALWDAKPGMNLSGKRFYVFMGGSYGKSRIIKDEELDHFDLDAPSILSVPVELRDNFEMNVATALRDIAGISTAAHQLLFDRESQIRSVETNRLGPFDVDEIPLGVSAPQNIDEYFNSNRVMRFNGQRRVPRMYPGNPRFIHVDLSKNQDPTGIAMVCAAGMKKIETTTPEGKTSSVLVPQCFVDFAIRLRAPEGDEIDYEKIRLFINYLRTSGYPIAGISFDQYQSTDSMQMLKKQGFRSSYISVDRSDNPYLALHNAFVQQRIDLYHYAPLVEELRHLEHHIDTGKVDHPDMLPGGGPGSKDIADALCGAFWSMSQAFAAVKVSAATPTKINLANLAGPMGRMPEHAGEQAFFRKLGALPDNPDDIATADWQEANKVHNLK